MCQLADVFLNREERSEGRNASLAKSSPKRLVYDVYHSVNLRRTHHPRHLIELFRRHGQQIFWRLEPGGVAKRKKTTGINDQPALKKSGTAGLPWLAQSPEVPLMGSLEKT